MKLFPILATFLMATGLAHADIFTPSVQKQIELGKEAAKEIRQKEKVLPDSDPRVIELRRIGKKFVDLIPADERKKKPFEYSFDVIDSKEINAFALPGGPVFFYTGLLDKLKYEDEVAGILGHELTHVQHEHWAHQYASSLRRNLGLIVALTLLRANDDWFTVANMYDSLTSLQYSRGDEQNADDNGFKWMVDAGYNPQGMADVFKILMKEGGNGGPEFLSSHPDIKNRITKLEDKIKASKQKYPAMRKRKAVSSSKIVWVKGWPRLVSSDEIRSSWPVLALLKQY